jgi:hypothetical protein
MPIEGKGPSVRQTIAVPMVHFVGLDFDTKRHMTQANRKKTTFLMGWKVDRTSFHSLD